MRISAVHGRKVVFAVFLFGISLLIYFRHRQIEEQGTLRWFDRPVVFLTSPVAQAVIASRDWAGRILRRYLFLVGVEEENEILRDEITELRERNLRFGELERENEEFRKILDLKNSLEGEWLAARVIGYPPLQPYRILTVDKGSEAGVQRRAPVVSAEGLVGQVSRVLRNRSQILLIIDPTSAVDGRVEGTGPDEARGLVVGRVLKLQMERELFITAFEYLQKALEIPEGARVVTSGMDGVYPPGVEIGRIRGEEKKKYDVFQEAQVIPSVDFYHLREVLILKR